MEKSKTDRLGRRIWSPYEEGTLNGLWIANLDYNKMAELLNTTSSAIEKKIDRIRGRKVLGNRMLKDEFNLIEIAPQTDVLIKYLEKRVAPINQKIKLVQTKPKTGKRIWEEVVLLLSDFHIGKRTKSFNLNVLSKKLESLCHKVINMTTIQRNTYNIENLHIFINGDIVDNDSIYPGHAHYIEYPVIDQIFLGYPMLRNFILSLKQHFKTITIDCVYGNHGRISKFAHKKTNWDYVLYKILQLELQEQDGITINVSEDFYYMSEVLGWNFLNVHGDCIKSYLNIPYYGLTNALQRWAGSMPTDFDYMCCGHWHSSGTIDWNDKTIILNGCMPTDDDYALREIKMKSKNKQWFFGVHEKEGRTWTFDIKV